MYMECFDRDGTMCWDEKTNVIYIFYKEKGVTWFCATELADLTEAVNLIYIGNCGDWGK